VRQFHQPHNLFARFREVADAELPGLTGRLEDGGCVWVDPVAVLPPSITDREPRPGDDRLRFVTGRRPVTEAVVAAAADEQPGVTVRRGVRIAGLMTGAPAIPGVPHVTGVRTEAGEEIPADLVVDAMGRRTKAPEWLAEVGARPPLLEAEDLGFVYYTQYFTGPTRPRRLGPGLMPLGSVSILTLDGDNDTWSVTLFGRNGDAPLKALRHTAAFARVVGACPVQAHWLDGRPLTEVLPMAGILDCHRRYVVDGQPVVTGLAAVGDAWACTNPSAGRGLSIGIIHAQLLRAVVASHLGAPATLARVWDECTEQVVGPFYRNQVAADRIRIAEMRAVADGGEPPAADPLMSALPVAGMHDPDVFRAMIEMLTCLALPQEVFARPGMRERIEQWKGADPRPAPGPDRGQLLQLLDA
jgi:2-polyprenyl-6-methoxyphenol hydroxylase-like FAD-dependent oxidoreductase